MSIQAISDTAKAKEYLLDQLTQGTTLSRLVLQTIDFSRGEYRAGIPEGFDQRNIDFCHWVSGLRDEERAFARMTKRFIEEIGGTALIADTESMSSQGAVDQFTYRDHMVTYGDEVYWQIAGATLSEDDIIRLLHAPILPYPLCIFLYLPKSTEVKRRLDYTDLEQIVRSLVGIAVAAFDTESFLLWWRDDVVSFSSVAAS